MIKSLLISIIALLFAISNLNAKTIWILDKTNNHSSMITFYNALIEDLKLTKYNEYIKTVTDIKQINEQIGDAILSLNGEGYTSNTGNITQFFWIGCIVDQCNNWAYRTGRSWIFSDEYIYKNSREARIDIVEFLDEWF